MSTWQPYYRRYRPADKLNISGVKPRNFADFALVYKREKERRENP